MSPLVVVFPGQGSQRVGMAQDFHDAFQVSRDAFDEAGEALRIDLRALCFEEGSEGGTPRLDLTENTQPAILTAEIAMLRALQTQFGRAPTHFAGHSLGEYTALVAAGVLPLGEAARLVRERGRRMQAAVAPGDGAMAAIIGEGLDLGAVRGCLDGLQVDLANLNSSDQVVISGAAADLETALARIRQAPPLAGVRSVPIPVSAPFHSRLMSPIEPGFRALLQESAAGWRPERATAVASNYTGTFHAGDRDALVDALTRQISGSVRWVDDMRALLALDPGAIYEVGPGRPLRAFFLTLGVPVEGITRLRLAERLFHP